MDNDDVVRGRLLTRREALAGLGGTGVLLVFGGPSSWETRRAQGSYGGCVARPELTEGPYYVDEELNRSDIRSDPSDGTVQEGALLALTFNVSRIVSNA